jgi:hypothetical protein
LSDESTALVPIEEKKVNFYGDEITAVLIEINGQRQVYVPVRPLCEYLGLTWSSQYMRLKRDDVLAEAVSSVLIMRTEVGQRYEVVCLQLEFLPGWLFGISTSRVRPDLQAKIKRYRRECYRVLWQAFQADVLSLVDQGVIETTPATASLLHIRDMGLAIARMAEQQLEQEQRLVATNKRLDVAGAIINQMDLRLGEVERRINPPQYVTDEMATAITLAVKALAEELSRHDPSKNHYQSVYIEIYRRFRAPSYDRIRIDRYEAVMNFLEDWQKSIDKHSQPGLFNDSAE